MRQVYEPLKVSLSSLMIAIGVAVLGSVRIKSDRDRANDVSGKTCNVARRQVTGAGRGY